MMNKNTYGVKKQGQSEAVVNWLEQSSYMWPKILISSSGQELASYNGSTKVAMYTT